MLKNWQNWCRLCAKSNGNDYDLFIKYESISNLAQIIHKYFNLAITTEDGRPRLVCENCFNILLKFNKFEEQCRKVDLMYSEFLYGNLKTSLTEYDIKEIRSKFNLDNEDAMSIDNVNIKIMCEPMVSAIINEENSILHEENNRTFNDLQNASIEVNKIDLADELQHYLDNNNTDSEEGEEEIIKPKARKAKEARKVMVEEDEPEKTKKKKRKKFTDEYLPIRCEECGKNFNSKHSLRCHQKTAHNPNLVLYSCSKCPKQFNRKETAKRHEIVHLPPELRLIHPCSYCDKKFSKAYNVQLHIRAVHHCEKPYICDNCGKSFCTTSALKEHQVIHSDEKPFPCPVCPQKFKNSQRLKIHEQIHNDKKYACKICGLELNTNQTLTKHMAVHSDVKSYKCQYCGNEYKRSKSLKNHLILHTGLKPYSCPFCDKTFANGANCRSHKKKAHPIELAAAEAAGYTAHTKNIPKLEQLQPKNILPHIDSIASIIKENL